ESKSPADALHLTVGAGRTPFRREHLTRLEDEPAASVKLSGDTLQEVAPRVAALLVGGDTQVLGQARPARQTAHRAEAAESSTGVGRNLDHAPGLPSHGPLAAFGEASREPQLPGRQEQQTPCQTGPSTGVPAHSGFAALVAQEIGERLDDMRRSLP